MNVVVVILVVVVLILCGGVFLLYNQEKGANNDAVAAKQAYNSLNDSYNDISSKYAALVSSDTDLNQRYSDLDRQYKNMSSSYTVIKNQSDTATLKLGEFLEGEPTVAYKYGIAANSSANNTTAMTLTVNVYNVCSADINNVKVKVTIQSVTDNSTGELVKTIPTLPYLRKDSVQWDLDNTSRVQSVWVGL